METISLMLILNGIVLFVIGILGFHLVRIENKIDKIISAKGEH